ncbi:unnamed protein product [Soboliphyme baturini]|uniref:EB domain-containing protein n=1 Tax=Soboliphyme baturini TaxID=241478 RepID=A0A183IUZ2_9BILA|nr:unnamed protein product [Soboliphyme baturini]
MRWWRVMLVLLLCAVSGCRSGLSEAGVGIVGYQCSESGTCADPNSECRFNRCHCKRGFDVTFSQYGCVKRKKLLESCTKSGQCISPFSMCDGSKCVCQKGFKEKNGACVPRKYSCMSETQPLKGEDGSVSVCRLVNGEDTCPTGSYCVSFSERHDVAQCHETMVQYGICCPTPEANVMPNPKCPVGDTFVNFTECQNFELYRFHYDPHVHSNAKVCCVRACPFNFVYVEGECYPIRFLPGEPCTVDEQCNCGYCKDGVCACKNKYLELYGKCYGKESLSSFTDLNRPSLISVEKRCLFSDHPVQDEKRCSREAPECPEHHICIQELNLCCMPSPVFGAR